MTLVGAGRDQTILRASSARSASTVLVAGSNASLRGMTVDGNGATGRAIDVSHAVNVSTLVQDVKVTGLGANAIGVEVWGEHHGVTVQDSVIDGGNVASKGIHDWLGSRRLDRLGRLPDVDRELPRLRHPVPTPG